MAGDTVQGLRMAAPYLRLYQSETFVVKFGGEAVSKPEGAKLLLEQVGVLQSLGIRVVVVHGGGPQATALADRLGAKSQFIDGRRVTDKDMLYALGLALNGEVQTTLLACASTLGVPAVGLSGISAGLIRAEKRPVEKVDFGFVGDIVDVDANVLVDLLEAGYLPIVSSLCVDQDGQCLNVNADTVASQIAVAIGAAKLVLVTGARGILSDPGDPGSLISHMTLSELEALGEAGVLKDGMSPKSAGISAALIGGVKRVHVISYDYPDSILVEVFTNEGCGTLVVEDESELESA
jgi:acetylglutamate kinase